MKSLKTNLKIVFAAALGAMAMSSCSNLETSTEGLLYLDGPADIDTIGINSKESWIVEISDTSWIDVEERRTIRYEIDGEKYDSYIVVKVNWNNTGKDRSGSITIKTSKENYIIPIQQSVAFQILFPTRTEWREKNEGYGKRGNSYFIYERKQLETSKYRLPTREECQDLIDSCEWIETTKDGVKGVVAKRYDRGVFFPGFKKDYYPAFYITSTVENGYIYCLWASMYPKIDKLPLNSNEGVQVRLVKR